MENDHDVDGIMVVLIDGDGNDGDGNDDDGDDNAW